MLRKSWVVAEQIVKRTFHLRTFKIEGIHLMNTPFHAMNKMSDTLFGGASTTVAEVGQQLAALAKKIDGLVEKQAPTRNPNLLADAVVVKQCPEPLVGCNPSLLDKATGGILSCPPIDQAPDPLIVRPNGQICYARKSLLEQFKGKNVNISDLHKEYSEKLWKLMSENPSLVKAAIENAVASPKGNPMVINFYANNPYVVAFANASPMAGGPNRSNSAPTGSRFGVNPANLLFSLGQRLVTANELAAMLTKFSDTLGLSTGAALLTEVMSSTAPNVAQGVFDVDEPQDVQRLNGVGQVSTDAISFPTHSFILNYLFTVIAATHRDSVRRAKIAEAVNGLAVALEFGELGKSFDSTLNRRHQAVTAAASAIAFLPRSFRDWIAAGKVEGPNTDSRFTLAMFVTVSLALATLEAFDTSAGTKYINCIKALRDAYNSMRSTENAVQQLLKKKADGSTVFEEEIQAALRTKRGAAQGYVQQTVKLGKVIAELLSEDLSGSVPVLQPTATHLDKANTLITNQIQSIAVQDPQLSEALRRVNTELFQSFLRELRGENVGAGLGLFSSARAVAFYSKVIAYSKLSALQAAPEEEVFVDKAMFSTAANAKQFAENVRDQDKAKFAAILPSNETNFCKVKTSGKFVYLWAQAPPVGFNGAAVDGFRASASEALKDGNKREFQTAIQGFASLVLSPSAMGYIVKTSCEPLESGEDSQARKFHMLGYGPIDALVRGYLTRNQGAAEIAQMETGQGMNKNQRDAYTTLQVILHFASGDLKSANLAATMLVDNTAVSDALVRKVFTQSSARPNTGENVSATTTFASHGPLKGGEDAQAAETSSIEGGEDVDIEGGDDWESFADKLLNGGGLPAIVPAHQSPPVIQEAMRGNVAYGKNREDVKKAIDDLEKMGYKVTFFKVDECPTFLSGNNNTRGIPGNRGWVKTNSAWGQCLVENGYQFYDSNGFCVPEGSTCHPKDDLKTATLKTIAQSEHWRQLASIWNYVQTKKLTDALEAEKERIRSAPQNAGLTDDEVTALAQKNLPADMQLPSNAAVQTLTTLSTQIEDAVSEIAPTGDASQREEIKRILKATGSMRDDWADEDKTMEAANLNRIASSILDDAKKCTDASLAIANNVAADYITSTLATQVNFGGANVAQYAPTVDPNVLVAADTKCDVLKTGDGPADAVLIPKTINQKIDTEKIAKGEPVDPIVNWWRTYYGAKAHEEAKKIAKIAAKVSPFEGSIPKPAAESKNAEELLKESLQKALGKRGLSMVDN